MINCSLDTQISSQTRYEITYETPQKQKKSKNNNKLLLIAYENCMGNYRNPINYIVSESIQNC